MLPAFRHPRSGIGLRTIGRIGLGYEWPAVPLSIIDAMRDEEALAGSISYLTPASSYETLQRRPVSCKYLPLSYDVPSLTPPHYRLVHRLDRMPFCWQ